jgi:chromosome segregation ATPase
MENDIKSKRKEKRGGETIDKSKETIEKYQNINYSSLTLDDCEKVRKYYIHRLDEINKLKENNEVKELVDLAESFIKKIIALETESFSLESKHKSLQTETNNIQKTTSEINRKINDKEKYSKLIIEKINVINADKQKIISEESEKRNVVVKETENFVRTLQSKYEEELPEKKKLIEENQLLRSEIEQCIKNSGNLKDLLESQLKEKEKASEDIENKIKNDLKSKMENMSFHAQKYIFENSELKIQIANYRKKNEELSSLVDAFNKEYDKLKNELEKVK